MLSRVFGDGSPLFGVFVQVVRDLQKMGIVVDAFFAVFFEQIGWI